MTKANRQQTDAALKSLPREVRGVLVYGPDEGLVRERAQCLAAQIVPGVDDPFRIARLAPDGLKAEPTRLADEMSAISMTGGRRLVRLEGAADGHAGIIEEALAAPGEALLLVSAGELPARSKLRALFEKERHLLAIACYADEARDLTALVREMLEAAGLGVEPDALAWLGDSLGGDRQLSRREIEKLILYKGDEEPRRISLGDARAVIGDASAMTLGDLAGAVTGGDVARTSRLLDKASEEGESPVAILRVLARRVQQIHLVRGEMARGLAAAQAVDRLVPRLFFRERDRFLHQIARWSVERAAAALGRLTEAEADCKATGMPAQAICARTCLALAVAAARGR